MDATSLLILLAGLLLAAWNTWQHLGRSEAARSWAGSVQGELKIRSVLVIRPMLAVVLVFGALATMTSGDATGTNLWLVWPIPVALLVAFGYMVAPLPIPRWAQPGWFREPPARSGRQRAHG